MPDVGQYASPGPLEIQPDTHGYNPERVSLEKHFSSF